MSNRIEIDESDINDRAVFDEFTDSISPSLHDILISMISDKDNISLKTEIQNPKALTFLYMFKEYVKTKGYTIFSEFLNSSINIYLEYMVSNQRKSRKEVIRALSSWYEREFTSKSNQLNVKQIE